MATNTTCDVRLEKVYRNITAIANYSAFPLLLETALISAFTLIMIYFVFQRWNARSRIFSWSLILPLFLYTLTIICWAGDVWNLWAELYLAVPAELLPARHDADKAAYARAINTIQDMQNLLTPIVMILSDLITLWRVYVIFARARWVLALLVLVGVAETGLSIYAIYLTTFHGLDGIDISPVSEGIGQIVELTTFVGTAACQVFAACMIFYKAWLYRRSIKQYTGVSGSRRSISMMLLVVESGFFYAMLWVYNAILYAEFIHSWDTTAFYWASYFVPTIAGMYPTLVVMLVAAQGSLVERSIQHTSLPDTVQFAIPVTVSMVEAETTSHLGTVSLEHSINSEREEKMVNRTLREQADDKAHRDTV